MYCGRKYNERLMFTSESKHILYYRPDTCNVVENIITVRWSPHSQTGTIFPSRAMRASRSVRLGKLTICLFKNCEANCEFLMFYGATKKKERPLKRPPSTVTVPEQRRSEAVSYTHLTLPTKA